jgi:diaminopimelate decarboxylase
MPNIVIKGVDCHIGSQIIDLAPFGEALDRLLSLIERLNHQGIQIEHIDLGGGIGIRYQDETPPNMAEYARILIDRLNGRPEQIVLEPGRRIVGNAGLLLTRVEYTKSAGRKQFALVDAAMNDLMRPALYEAWHEVTEVKKEGAQALFDIAGPVCESGDILARDRLLQLHEGSLLAILSAGAYGSSMSSNYNTRPRPAEVLIKGKKTSLIRKRELLSSLWEDEIIPS